MTQVCELLGVAAEVAAIRYPSLRRSRLAGIRPAGCLIEGFGVLGQPAGRCRETCRSSQHGG